MNDLLVGLIGSLMTLIAAFIGFWGVIYSQRKLMKMADAERVHQERLAREQAAEERRAELNSFINAVLGELSALQGAIGNAGKVLDAQRAIAEELAHKGIDRKTQPRIAFRFATPVFNSHVGRIGLLNPDLSFKLSSLYGHILSFSTQSQDQVPEMDPALAVKVMRSVDANLKSLADEIEALKAGLAKESGAIR
jgi:hypothetical protein